MAANDDRHLGADGFGSALQGRRSFLKQAGIAGGVAGATWAVPTIVSQTAAAAATCATRTLNWGTAFGVPPAPSAPVPSGSAVVLGPTTVTFSFTDPTSAVATSGVDSVFTRGGPTYHMQLNSTGAGPVDILLSFSTPVTSLSFSVLDVDQDTTPPPGGWQDRITVQGLSGVTPQTASTASGGPDTTDTSVPPTYVFTGNANAPNPGTNGDVAFAWAVPVDSVTISYQRTGAVLSQGIGLSNITFCS